MGIVRIVRRALGLVGLTLVLGQAGVAAAQDTPRFVPSLDSIGPGCCTLRVRQNGLTAQGKFQGRPGAGTVLLIPCKGPLCSAVEDPSQALTLLPGAFVEMRSGSHAGLGAIIGSATGAGILWGLLLLGGGDVDVSVGEVGLIGLVGGLGGAVLGMAVGAVIPRWVPVRH